MSQRFRALTVLSTFATLFTGSASFADIVSVTGAATVVPPPASVAVGAMQSDTQMILFTERHPVVIPNGGVSVDVKSPGSYTGGGPAPDPGTLAAGTVVETYFLHSDPVKPVQEYKGSVTFDTPVLGLIFLDKRLDATDATLGHPGTTYPTGVAARGLESEDSVSLSADLRTVSFDVFTHDSVDEIRIITAIPEPSSLLLGGLMSGTLAVAFLRRGPRASD